MFEPKTPFLATDAIVEAYDQQGLFCGIVLIERRFEPIGLALPGGFVERGECVESALVREMKEEIGLKVHIQTLLGVFSDPKRDKRFHTASVVYIATATGTPEAGDDAKAARIFKLEEIPYEKLLFDHAKILKRYLCTTHRV